MTSSASDDRPRRRGRGRPPGAGVVDDDDLLDRALAALARGGYRSLSMRGLARELGVSLASVQHRHRTKDALWRAAIDRLIDETVQDSPPAAPEAFPAALYRRIAAAARYPGLIVSLLSDDAPGHEERLAYLVERITPSFTSARAAIGGAGAAGLTRDIDVEVFLAMMVIGVGAVGAIPDALGDVLDLGDDPAQRLATGIADVLLHGIVTRDAAFAPDRLDLGGSLSNPGAS